MSCMSYEKFKHVMNILIEFKEQRGRISDFIEKEISTSTYCICDIGNDIESALINLLADEFNCWYSLSDRKDYNWWKDTYNIENDIENWLYSISDKPKTVTINKVKYNVDSLEDLYKFLVKQYNKEV